MNSRQLSKHLNNIEFYINSIQKELALINESINVVKPDTPYQKRKAKSESIRAAVRAKREAYYEKKKRNQSKR